MAAVLLAASAGWMAVGNVAATDMPLAASFNAAVLATLLWLKSGQRRWAIAAGAFLGLALLAKGLVGAALFLPLLWFARKRLGGLLLLFAACAVVALPWYVAVTARHGMDFIQVFFIEHHFGALRASGPATCSAILVLRAGFYWACCFRGRHCSLCFAARRSRLSPNAYSPS